MAFTSLQFLAFFALAVPAFWLAPRRARGVVLLAANALYMGSFGAPSLAVLAVVTLLTWACGLGIGAARTPAGRRAWLAAGLLGSAGYLFARKAAELAAAGGSPLAAAGLAFYALQAAGYLADVFCGRCPAQKSLLRYAVYVSFFPRVLSGPIGRAGEFFPQLDTLLAGLAGSRFDPAAARAGLITMLCGYAQKLLLADLLAVPVDTVFAAPADYGGAVLALAVVLFGFSLYFDFVGYSSIAIGAAQVLGVTLRANFRRPYLAQSFQEFWRRWHISLSGWLRDYIYIPLGGSRRGRGRKYCNLLATFLVSGLWHGTGWQYLAWGGIHAFYQIAGDCTARPRAALRRRLPGGGQGPLCRFVRRAFVLLAADAAWLFFRAPSLGAALAMGRRILTGFRPADLGGGALLTLGLAGPEWAVLLTALTAAFALEFAAEAAERRGTSLYAGFGKLPAPLRRGLLLALTVLVMLFGCRLIGGGAADFYYAQF